MAKIWETRTLQRIYWLLRYAIFSEIIANVEICRRATERKPERARKPERLKNVWDPIHFSFFYKSYNSIKKNLKKLQKKICIESIHEEQHIFFLDFFCFILGLPYQECYLLMWGSKNS